MLFGTEIKSLQPAILIYSNQDGESGFIFSTVDVSHVDGERVAFWNSRHSLGRQMTERLEVHRLGH